MITQSRDNLCQTRRTTGVNVSWLKKEIAFPKNNKATDPMTQAPSTVALKQLEELSLQVEEDETSKTN